MSTSSLPAADELLQTPRTLQVSSVAGSLLTVHEVAQLLRVPVSWVYAHTRRRSRDRIPGFRLGKYWRFDEAQVRRWVESKK